MKSPTCAFQSTPPHGRRPPGTGSLTMCLIRFQSTPPHGRRPALLVPTLAPLLLFQSTPPHGRRRYDRVRDFLPLLFQSTPPHGRRRPHAQGRVYFAQFQSTPPHGRRRGQPLLRVVDARVSIHASAREATAWSRIFPAGPARFNPRLRTGGDCDRRWPARLKDLRV